MPGSGSRLQGVIQRESPSGTPLHIRPWIRHAGLTSALEVQESRTPQRRRVQKRDARYMHGVESHGLALHDDLH